MTGEQSGAAVLLPGRADDGGWVEAGARAVAALKRAGVSITATAQTPFTPEQALLAAERLAGAGTRLIIGHGHEYIEAFLRLAPAHPGSFFFTMDHPGKPQTWPENFCCLHQRQDEAAYLCGRLAAYVSKTGRLGFVGGQPVPTQVSNGHAFERGARSLRPDIAVRLEYAGSFEDPQRGGELTMALIDADVDVLLHTASETGNGVIEACNRRGAYVIGYTLDQSALAPQWMLTSLLVDVLQIYKRKVAEAASGRFRSGVWVAGVADGLVGLAPLSAAVPADVAEDIDQVRRAILTRAVVV